MGPACATMAPLQKVVSPELPLRIRAFRQTNISGNSNDLCNAFNMSATSQATRGDSPASRGPYWQNGVTTRLSATISSESDTSSIDHLVMTEFVSGPLSYQGYSQAVRGFRTEFKILE